MSSAGAQQNGASHDPVISGDGRYVAFRSSATNLVAGDTNGQRDVFVRDRQTGVTSRVSVSSAGGQGSGGSDDPAISDDGRYVAFQSDATNLVAGDTNAATDVFLHDRQTGATTRVSVSSTGVQGNAASDDAAISGDGSTVAWESAATNLVADDTNAKQDIFVHDVATGATTLVSVSSTGTQGTKSSNDPSVSADGTRVGFSSTASNLVAGDTNSRNDIFVHDRTTGETIRKSLTAVGAQANEANSDPWISGDGTAIAFESVATNLVPEDTDATKDVFVRGPSFN